MLIGGDLNTDRSTDGATGAFTRMTEILEAVLPDPPRGRGYEPTRSGRLIDYVLYEKNHLQPIEAFNAVRPVVSNGLPLSDHSAVHGHFVFGPAHEPAQARKTRNLEVLN